ncbi:MAG: hypothetical protein MSH13_04415, partial [Ruminococcus callidus]|nr:hypothetical protein [Ruminococcus callidus]
MFMHRFPWATPHKARLTALHAICVQIFRQIAQKSLAIRQYACGIAGQSAEKSDNAPYAQALCGIALAFFSTMCYTIHKRAAAAVSAYMKCIKQSEVIWKQTIYASAADRQV